MAPSDSRRNTAARKRKQRARGAIRLPGPRAPKNLRKRNMTARRNAIADFTRTL